MQIEMSSKWEAKNRLKQISTAALTNVEHLRLRGNIITDNISRNQATAAETCSVRSAVN